MINRDQGVLFLHLDSLRCLNLNVVLIHQHVRIIPIAVQNSNVQDGYLVDLLDREAIGSIVPDRV